ncbi:hypothetical protein SERLA73DRAFT_148849 [Serpula lacrymans var. lacrymans S7.3]|uniref:Uncharacterized protein n=2 Tax=Serpula lacrymans var. lacrymans TaxID=341189 RepID=F8PFR4_SERL3|nr:uncharacterized protein SERLADRAFT_431667 [Serpula lacrymans var. lacrymans S7.9]EGO04265.1 hypothetical protein SERLA73DRAFT_148849 [Serpula lacrymans var. lacrymans S7.3]EGO30197.1 hypothetical protein SERLADRAFT_431667 [Serpula lacrymans var. lacrymans S7.9]
MSLVLELGVREFVFFIIHGHSQIALESDHLFTTQKPCHHLWCPIPHLITEGATRQSGMPAGLEDACSARLLSVQQCLTVGEIVALVPMPYADTACKFLELVFSSREKELAADAAHKKLQALHNAGNFPSWLGSSSPEMPLTKQFKEEKWEESSALEKAYLAYKKEQLDRAIALKLSEASMYQNALTEHTMYNYIVPKFAIIHKEQTRLCQIPTLGMVDSHGIEGPLRVVAWEELMYSLTPNITKWSLKADADVAMGEVMASGSKSMESLIDRKVSTAFKKIQKLHNAHIKERKNKINFVKRAAKRRRKSTDQSEGASRSNAAPPPAKKGKKSGEPYKGKINKLKKDRKGKWKAPRK